MLELGNPKTIAAVLASAVLGAGASVAVGACGERRGGEVKIEQGTGTGGSGTTGTGATGTTGTGAAGAETGTSTTGTGTTSTDRRRGRPGRDKRR